MKISKKVLILTVVCVVAVLSLVFCLRTILNRPKQIVKAEIAIVIDDWGYNLDNIELLKKIDVPVTISILPNLRYSSQVARIAKELKQEVILHLPLEPEIAGRDYLGLEHNTITVQMAEDEVIDNFELALASVPEACGVSNHMGSRATKNETLMRIIFAALKKRKLFFLDNLVTNQSICRELAKKMQLKFVARDFFLDNEDNYEYIKGQFEKLISFALENSSAVGLGHARAKTLEVLSEEIPLMQAKGIRLVFVSDLTK